VDGNRTPWGKKDLVTVNRSAGKVWWKLLKGLPPPGFYPEG